MNGAHDLGGMQNFGPVAPEAGEPVFHHDWERRVLGLTLAMGATGRWNIDQSRSARESLQPAQYLASSYYQIWLEGLLKLIQERALVTPEEIAAGQMRQPPGYIPGVLSAARVATVLARGSPTARAASAPARFAIGDAVRTRNIHPSTHTRLPRYCRGKPCTILATHGAHVFADANARGEGAEAHWLHTVRFDAHDLWGSDTTATAVHADCWEPYLEAR